MRPSSILGKNARSQLFSYKYNLARGKRIAQSKLLTARVLTKAQIPTPEIYKHFKTLESAAKFDWTVLPGAFVIKPDKGLGGEGILVIKKRANRGEAEQVAWITTQRERVTQEDLKFHVLDILEGANNASGDSGIALIQEYVGRHKAFRKYAYRGTPDIRIIVFNRVPIMAMLRLPTKESGGRANLHQGAIGVGVDITTGITTKAIWHEGYIKRKPGTNRKLNGIKIPSWSSILEIAVRCQEVTGLGYLGADIILHPDKGPMVLELNNQPGLSIQLANEAGLRKRLDRVEDLKVRDAEHGVNIAKALFSSRFADRVKATGGVRTVNIFETIKIKVGRKKKISVEAKLDTGAWSTSIDRTLAKELGLLRKENVLWYKKIRSALGTQRRPVIGLTFWLAGRKIQTNANVANRSKLKKKVVIGRKALKGFLVNPTK